MIDRAKFFSLARMNPFNGTMTQGQVDGCNAILDEWDAKPELTDRRWLAYMLATPFKETNRTMQPVREAYFLGEPKAESYRKTLRYYPFYGRGLVQLTWERNYRIMGALFGVDLTGNPDLALDPRIAVLVMFEGMLKADSSVGDFTGASLEQYFSATRDDPVHARQIINGMDCAEEIAGYHRAFLAALT